MSIVKVPQILLPTENIELEKWSVIACDQFTSQKEYWEKLDKFCGEISTLRITYPEIYLNDNQQERIKKINSTMVKYVKSGIFRTVEGFILTVRKTSYNRTRVGLMISFDLEEYDYVKSLEVRATEATVPERLPVRVKIRENACLELPHAILLINDKDNSIIEPLYNDRAHLQKVYDTKLNNDGGSVKGYLVEDSEKIISLLDGLKAKTGDSFTFAVGDGNHSIATAKLCWEQIKKNLTKEQQKNHPARYCLCEVVNLYEEDLIFEPINRVVFNANMGLISHLQNNLKGDSQITLFYNNKEYKCNVDSFSPQAIADIQKNIDDYIKLDSHLKQDYVHGFEHTKEVSLANNGVGIFMPQLKKEDLFGYISMGKILTRKSFSMGEAEEKRYYLEAKKIKENV